MKYIYLLLLYFLATTNVFAQPHISGIDTVCVGDSIMLSGGIYWSSTDTLVATITQSGPPSHIWGGVVTGVSVGTTTISCFCDPFACSRTEYVVACHTSVTQLSSQNSIDIYPNPTNDIFNISWQNQPVGIGDLYITDVTGRQLYYNHVYINTPAGNTPVNISGLSNGLYFIILRSGNNYYRRRLIIR